MIDKAMTNMAIAAELGRRLEQLRLGKNMTQQALAKEIGITAKSYRQLIAGGGKLENMIAALRALDALQQLDSFLPEPPPSPLEQLKMRGKQRQRARSTHRNANKTYPAKGTTDAGNVREPEVDW